MGRKTVRHAGSCEECLDWGVLPATGVCADCANARTRARADGPRVSREVPTWLRARFPERGRDDPALCPPELPGQLGLFPTPRRQFALTDGARIHDRDIPDAPQAFAAPEQMARERGVGPYWLIRTRPVMRLALAAREPGEHQVRPEAVRDLPALRPTTTEALHRAGLLAPPTTRRIVSPGQLTHGSCAHCYAWANDRRRLCEACASWQYVLGNPDPTACTRCRRVVPTSGGRCRFCRIVEAETEIDTAAASLDGGDQLWFAGPLAPALAVLAPGVPAVRRGRFDQKRRLARAADSGRPLSSHLVDPGQFELLPAPARDWTALAADAKPALTPEAAALVDDFTAYIRSRGWSTDSSAATCAPCV
ncbi:hypothetical protein ACFWIQ_14205 [Kitasatospora sp. NPDC127059]|uniref:hypothetical protein n=1 Tax=unclassified Kitasatospora TaxID=2633591 RepID=UPI00364D2D20